MRRRFTPLVLLVVVGAFLPLAGCTSTADQRDGMDAASAESVSVPVVSPAAPLPRAGTPIAPRNAYVLLSGGGTPLTNNYSQYLQARAIAAFFARACPPDSTWVFFGAGNREGMPPVLGDARRELKRGGLVVQSWEPGILPGNRPATRDEFLRALRDEILPTVRSGGTLYLFVGDHGEVVGKGDERESAITLWQMKRRRRSGDWYSDDNEVLKVRDLRAAIASGLGEGRVVFAMTQCHSGGFHELGIARNLQPPRDWFVGAPPAWAAGKDSGLRLRVAGFTATDQASPAAGCDADPDPERWAGYERFLPERLFGLDLMNGEAKGSGAASLAEAHEAATLIDATIDKPRSSSEHYLEAWARVIEERLPGVLTVAPKITAAQQRFQRVLDGAEPAANDAGLRERQAQFARFASAIAAQVPAARELVLQGTRQQLEAAIKARGERGGARGPRRSSMAELRKTWNEVLRPAWKQAVLKGEAGLSAAELALERELLKAEDDKTELLFPRGGDDTALLNELYWASGYATPGKLDRTRAETMARWAAERRTRIVGWAANSPNPAIRAAGQTLGPAPAFVPEPARPMTRRTAAERVLFYRRVIAAWEFLITVEAHEALAELQTLIEIERAPLPSVSS